MSWRSVIERGGGGGLLACEVASKGGNKLLLPTSDLLSPLAKASGLLRIPKCRVCVSADWSWMGGRGALGWEYMFLWNSAGTGILCARHSLKVSLHKTTSPQDGYLMIYRESGFLAVVWFHSSPTPFPPITSVSSTLRHTGRLRKRDYFIIQEGGGRGGRGAKLYDGEKA